MYKSVLFDFDGTIFDTGDGVMRSVQYALEKMGIYEDMDNLRDFMGPPLVSMFMEKYQFSTEQADQAVDFFRERYTPVGWKECKPYEGIIDVVKRIRDSGIEVLIATSKPTHFAKDILKMYQMEDLFDFVSGAELNGDRTTKQEVIQAALNASEFDVSDMVYVGDRKYDVVGAHHFHIPCIGVKYGFSSENELEEYNCDYIVDTPEQILSLVLS